MRTLPPWLQQSLQKWAGPMLDAGGSLVQGYGVPAAVAGGAAIAAPAINALPGIAAGAGGAGLATGGAAALGTIALPAATAVGGYYLGKRIGNEVGDDLILRQNDTINYDAEHAPQKHWYQSLQDSEEVRYRKLMAQAQQQRQLPSQRAASARIAAARAGRAGERALAQQDEDAVSAQEAAQQAEQAQQAQLLHDWQVQKAHNERVGLPPPAPIPGLTEPAPVAPSTKTPPSGPMLAWLQRYGASMGGGAAVGGAVGAGASLAANPNRVGRAALYGAGGAVAGAGVGYAMKRYGPQLLAMLQRK